MRLIIFFLILVSCAQPKKAEYKNFQYLNFNKNLTFEEFENLLIKYNKSQDYPELSN